MPYAAYIEADGCCPIRWLVKQKSPLCVVGFLSPGFAAKPTQVWANSRLMYQCRPLQVYGASSRNRTGTIKDRGILSPLRLPIPPWMQREMMAEAVRFELTDGLPHRRFSRPVHSTALARFLSVGLFFLTSHM